MSPNQQPFYIKDPWLRPYIEQIDARASCFVLKREDLSKVSSLRDFASAHLYFGLFKVERGWILRERLPNAVSVAIYGDFCEWKKAEAIPLKKMSDGMTWEVLLPEATLKHKSCYKLLITGRDTPEQLEERVPAHAQLTSQDPKSKLFAAQVWHPLQGYKWRNPSPAIASAPLIYEAHIGMATEHHKVGTYEEFRTDILPRIKRGGYNTVQLMAIQEHPYYGSFGYQVSSFFAPTSRFGTPDELKHLIDDAHGMGLRVIMDLVHSHAVGNREDGIAYCDGTDYLYTHSGPTGEHPAWKTRLFNYGKDEVLHYLLSNCRYWLEEFHFDGFRFDGVTSMLYRDHGLGSAFDSYDRYFDLNIDHDACTYLTLANQLIKEINESTLSIAEDVSGYPGLAASVDSMGIGFDFRLAMGVPDFWIRTLKETADEDWNVSTIWHELTNYRAEEKTIGYCESHDQALVGDKTLIFRLADAAMYTEMSLQNNSIEIERAVALLKLIRTTTCSLSQGGYLNFMGNEFGHPEWVDFPREGNEWSFQYARRQWSLVDNTELRYAQLNEFDRAIVSIISYNDFFSAKPSILYEHVAEQILIYRRGKYVFALNFSSKRSYPDLKIAGVKSSLRIVVSSDEQCYGGLGRVTLNNLGNNLFKVDGNDTTQIYLPSRSALIFRDHIT